MSVTERYRSAWEGYWGGVPEAPGEVIWDSDPALAAEPHLTLLLPYADPALPVVDLGCGNGTRTRHLAGHFPRAVGVDLSRAAVERARRADPEGLAEYEQLDLVDAAAVRSLHERLGDCNVYMRAVIHQSDAADRGPVAAAVARLAGERGRAFVVELKPAAGTVLAELAQAPGGPPEGLRRVLEHGLRPAEAADGEVAGLLTGAGLKILAEGDTELTMTACHPDGRRVRLPARWFVTTGR
ncbi:class I SAM-dependent methyltransferase [Streptomyces sp. NPDC049555]|uniref:class I SAM-dependent methyltransferase n=1 Tax=unclassified Streptomyces TaxID=2593676 RepID=UPI00342382EC